MIDHYHEVFVSSHSHNLLGLAQNLFLNSFSREDPDVACISTGCHPLRSLGDGLNRLSILHLIMPVTGCLAIIEWFEIQMRCFLVNFILFDFLIFFVLILVLNLCFTSK